MSKSLATWFTPSLQTISRSAGRSAVAAAAYRACVKLIDQTTGLIHDYTRKGGHVETILIGADDISELWNKAELAETRKNSTVARELMLPLPDQWTDNERRECVRDIAQHLRDTYGVAVSGSIHAPNRHDRNNHVHMMFTTRTVDIDGTFGKKTRILDDMKTGEVSKLREAICKIVNAHAEKLDSDFYVYAGKFSDIDKNHIPTKHIPINAGGGYRNAITAQNAQITIHRANLATHEKKAELLKAELSNASILTTPESTPAPDAPRSVDVEKVEATPPAELESPFKRKKIPHACEIAYQKHQETLKKREQLEQLSKQWHKKYDELLAHEPTRTQRIFAKIGLGTEKIERYDLELVRAKKALSDIEHNKTVYQKILGDKNSLALIEQYNAIVSHNAKLWEAEAQALLAHSQKLERERELKEEQEREQATPAVDWTVGLDPTEDRKSYPKDIELGR
ncbi:MobA/MobL family protein [Acidovorax temperans]|uniref:MobA/MobL family protein n=1 Tax=Acidovorax temperans TaxID=80878 RepID=UPI00235A0028|nr:MobA/MobL family protein [Acidovorax temperans]WCT23358.1 MobA/MobL family protein [Acidovorax temperans]